MRIKKILILGGGTAGWLTALYLKKGLHKDTEIILVDSDSESIIGVGEATVPTLRSTMDFLDLKEEQWMKEADATFKLGVKFKNWMSDKSSYYHPYVFNRSLYQLPFGKSLFPEVTNRVTLIDYVAHTERKDKPFAYLLSKGPGLCDAKKSPRPLEGNKITTNYSYHIDSAKFGRHLKKIGVERGIKFIEDHYESGELNSDGSISKLNFKSGDSHSANLYIDCTGFKGLLINGLLKTPFIGEEDHLLCDSAIVGSFEVDYQNHKLNPYTTADAQNSGWLWKIPMLSRESIGYVYSSKYETEDQAEKAFSELVKERIPQGNFRKIKMRVGCNEKLWNKNCVAIGLSSAFVEPLESTSIGMTEYQIFCLLRYIPDADGSDFYRDLFNRKTIAMYKGIRDFIFLHYYLTDRKDTEFWKAVHNLKIPNSLKSRISNLSSLTSSFDDELASSTYTFFQKFGFACLLDGMKQFPAFRNPLFDHIDCSVFENEVNYIVEKTEEFVKELPDHYDYLKHFYSKVDTSK